MSKKTIEWLSQLPPGYRERAVAQFEPFKEYSEGMSDAICNMCDWKDTQEGFAFWLAVTNHYSHGYPLPPLPETDIAALKAEIEALRARDGDWKYYNEDGTLAITIKYKNGEKVRIDAHLFGEGTSPTEPLKRWVVPLAHPTLIREEVAARCVEAAEKKGYRAHADRYYMEFREDTTHFACYIDGVFCLRNHECNIKYHTTLEEFEAYCGVEQPKQEEYNAGFNFGGLVTSLNLPDDCSFYFYNEKWLKEPNTFIPKPHTLTPVERYTVGKFYALKGFTGEILNGWRNYALCVKNDDVPCFVRPMNENGVVIINHILPVHVSNLEVNPI